MDDDDDILSYGRPITFQSIAIAHEHRVAQQDLRAADKAIAAALSKPKVIRRKLPRHPGKTYPLPRSAAGPSLRKKN